jgi:hypothetical protein
MTLDEAINIANNIDYTDDLLTAEAVNILINQIFDSFDSCKTSNVCKDCIDCKYQTGPYLDFENLTWCNKIQKTVTQDFYCKDFKEKQ